MFGFMLITALLSMFISNTGATAMIIPIAVAVLDELESCQRKRSVALVKNDDTASPRLLLLLFFTPVLNSQGMKKITLCNTKSTKIKLE